MFSLLLDILARRRALGGVDHQLFMQTSNLLTQDAIKRGLSHLRVALERGRLPFVVLVEDDDLDASLFRSALRQAGVAVEYMRFDNAQQAIDFFHGKGSFADRNMFPLPNLTVLDWDLPPNGGFKVLEEIRSHPGLAQLTVIALTSSEDARQFEMARILKINDWIHKPESLAELVTIARRLKVLWLDETSEKN